LKAEVYKRASRLDLWTECDWWSGECDARRTQKLGSFPSVGAEYSNCGALRLGVANNFPPGDNAAARTAAIYVKHYGYMSDGTDDQDDLGAPLSLLVEPTKYFYLKVSDDYFR